MKIKQVFLRLLSLASLFLLSVGSLQVQAEEHKDYESRTGIGFYGSYEYPSDESSDSSEEPIAKPAPNEKVPDRPVDYEPTNNNQLVAKPVGRTLPSTGEIRNRSIGLIGLLIILIILLIVFINRKQNKKENI